MALSLFDGTPKIHLDSTQLFLVISYKLKFEVLKHYFIDKLTDLLFILTMQSK